VILIGTGSEVSLCLSARDLLAKENIATLDRYGVQTVVTACPHCFHQLGNE